MTTMHTLSNRRFDQPAARQWARVLAAGDGTHLGTITAPHPVHNFAWGDDGKTLYLCARTVLYRMPLLVSGVRP